MNALLAALLALSQDKAAEPLKPLLEISKELDRGIAEFVKGKDGALAFPAWEFKPRGLDKVRKGLAASAVDSAANLGFEIRLVFFKEGKPLYVVAAFVLFSGEKQAVIVARGADVSAYVGARPLEEFKEKDKAFADAASGWRKALEGEEWKTLPLADAEFVKKLIPESKVREQMLEDVSKVKADLESAAKRVAELKPDEVRVSLDDQLFLAKDAAGKVVGAIVSDFDSYAGRAISFRLKKFAPLE